MKTNPGNRAEILPLYKGLSPIRYVKVRFKDADRTKTVFLSKITESKGFLSGIEINKDGSEVIPKGREKTTGKKWTVRQRVIDKSAIIKQEEYGMSKKYATLEKRDDKQIQTTMFSLKVG